jgi:hypothetical protein
MPETPLKVFVGYDPAEDDAYSVCVRSMRATSSSSLAIEPLSLEALRMAGLYQRTFYFEDGQRYDTLDGKPFSTEFSFSRFLVPSLTQWQGWALFCDSDFLWREDVAKLFEYADESRAALVVKHDHHPREERKMRAGQRQQTYRRKNWSSLVLWNCAHIMNRYVTPFMVNHQPGWWLHGFTWLSDGQIGSLPPAWNWLDGYSSPDIHPRAVHYTSGTPDVPGHENAAHADEWRGYLDGDQ